MALFGRSKPQPSDSSPGSSSPLAEPTVPAPAGAPATERRAVDAHRENLLAAVSSLRPFGIGLLDAAGLTLCESIDSDIDLPVYTSASVAGWAVRGSNLVGASPRHPVRLPVVGEIDAGGYRGSPLMPGTVVKVAGGAPVPEGADAVVPLEAAAEVGDEVEFTAEATFQQELVLAGSRISDGDLLLGNGSVLDARAIGLLAEVGIDKVLARPKPRVVVASLGAELVDPGLPLERLHQVYDTGTPLVAALARADGAQVFPIGILPSDPSRLRRTITDQLPRADLVLLVAGRDDDLIGVLGELGTVDSGEVAMEPAGPAAFAVVGEDRTPVLVLPRGAAACYISYQVFARPLVRRLAGVAPSDREVGSAQVTRPLATDPTVTTFVLARTSDRGVEPLNASDAQTSLDLVAADTLIVVPPGTGEVGAHSDVTCWPLRG
ncbi:MAG: gephyrin-like molybdotransferase Glp [Propionicimonas sp.]|nr:molybdopterin molybdotransferase MoeA [Propionicimonas sp.]